MLILLKKVLLFLKWANLNSIKSNTIFIQVYIQSTKSEMNKNTELLCSYFQMTFSKF